MLRPEERVGVRGSASHTLSLVDQGRWGKGGSGLHPAQNLWDG